MSDIDLAAAAEALQAFLRAIGAPVGTDPELERTPERVTQAYVDDFLAGYRMDPAEILSHCTAADTSGLVLLRDIPATTMCPHHLMPASGVIHVGYWPRGRVVGFGAIGLLVDCFSRRLVLQEELGQVLTDELRRGLQAAAAVALVDLNPTCMTARGEKRHGARALTMAFSGNPEDEKHYVAEFLGALQVGNS